MKHFMVFLAAALIAAAPVLSGCDQGEAGTLVSTDTAYAGSFEDVQYALSSDSGGNTVVVYKNFTIPANQTLVIPAVKTLDLTNLGEGGITNTADGTIVAESDRISFPKDPETGLEIQGVIKIYTFIGTKEFIDSKVGGVSSPVIAANSTLIAEELPTPIPATTFAIKIPADTSGYAPLFAATGSGPVYVFPTDGTISISAPFTSARTFYVIGDAALNTTRTGGQLQVQGALSGTGSGAGNILNSGAGTIFAHKGAFTGPAVFSAPITFAGVANFSGAATFNATPTFNTTPIFTNDSRAAFNDGAELGSGVSVTIGNVKITNSLSANSTVGGTLSGTNGALTLTGTVSFPAGVSVVLTSPATLVLSQEGTILLAPAGLINAPNYTIGGAPGGTLSGKGGPITFGANSIFSATQTTLLVTGTDSLITLKSDLTLTNTILDLSAAGKLQSGGPAASLTLSGGNATGGTTAGGSLGITGGSAGGLFLSSTAAVLPGYVFDGDESARVNISTGSSSYIVTCVSPAGSFAAGSMGTMSADNLASVIDKSTILLSGWWAGSISTLASAQAVAAHPDAAGSGGTWSRSIITNTGTVAVFHN
jgi:hypothetical protein